jgi:hypothetical protein
MATAADSVGDAELAGWLTEDVPGAIVADAPIPDRPRSRRGRFRHLFRI